MFSLLTTTTKQTSQQQLLQGWQVKVKKIKGKDNENWT